MAHPHKHRWPHIQAHTHTQGPPTHTCGTIHSNEPYTCGPLRYKEPNTQHTCRPIRSSEPNKTATPGGPQRCNDTNIIPHSHGTHWSTVCTGALPITETEDYWADLPVAKKSRGLDIRSSMQSTLRPSGPDGWSSLSLLHCCHIVGSFMGPYTH